MGPHRFLHRTTGDKYSRKRQQRLQRRLARKQSLPTTVHHQWPRSRGGVDKEWNKKFISPILHKSFHFLFGNFKPAEIISVIKHNWTDENGRLRVIELGHQSKIVAWIRLFGTESITQTEIAVQKIKNFWSIPEDEQYKQHLDKLEAILNRAAEKIAKKFKKFEEKMKRKGLIREMFRETDTYAR